MAQLHKIMFILLIVASSLLLTPNARRLHDKRRKPTVIRVYVHDIRAGPNATIYEVARANITSTSPTFFGVVTVGDSLMTVGSDINSPKLGRAQGVSASTGSKEMSFTLNGAFIFTDGEYAGSTVTTPGWIRNSNETQEFPIVGGTGLFRLARGYVRSNVYSFDPTISYFLFQNDLYVYTDNKYLF